MQRSARVADDALPVVQAAAIEVGDGPTWLVETLWAEEGVGIVGGAPKCCLCRARHKQHYPASRIMPRDWVSWPWSP